MQEKTKANLPLTTTSNTCKAILMHSLSFIAESHYYLVNTKAGLLLKKEELRRSGDVGVRRRRLRDRKQRERKSIKKLLRLVCI